MFKPEIPREPVATKRCSMCGEVKGVGVEMESAKKQEKELLMVESFKDEFYKIAEIEPKLKELDRIAKSFKEIAFLYEHPLTSTHPLALNREYFWHHVIKKKMEQLVGNFRKNGPKEICDSKSYDVCYECLSAVIFDTIKSEPPIKQNQETRDRIQENVDYQRTKEMAEGGDPDAILTCFKNEFTDVWDNEDAMEEAILFVDEKLEFGKHVGAGSWDIYKQAGEYARKRPNSNINI